MDRCAGAAARLSWSDRRDLAVQALARSATIRDLSARHGVSRKFVCQQTHKARIALDDAFSSAASNDEVQFEVKLAKTGLRQAIVALALMCRGSYLGIIELMRDLLGISVSVGAIRNALQPGPAGGHDQPPPTRQPCQPKIRPSTAGCFRAPVVIQKRAILNHAGAVGKAGVWVPCGDVRSGYAVSN
jgi:hypothetical protein